MGRELIIHIWCDACTADGVAITGTEHRIQINDAPLKTLDLCERHELELLKPLYDLLAEYGAKPQARASITRAQRSTEPGPLQCLHCDASFASSSGLYFHAGIKHGFPTKGSGNYKATNAEDFYGLKCPACTFTASSAMALSAHGRHAHGAANIPALFTSMIQTDPHGVIAKRRASFARGKNK